MTRTALALQDGFEPWSQAASDEVSFLGGVDAFGNAVGYDYWQSAGTEARKWGGSVAGSPGGQITFGFAPSQYGYGWNTADEQRIIAGLALWSAVADIQFVLVPYSDSNPPQITFRYTPDGQTATATYAYPAGYAQPGTPYLGTMTAALTWFDPPGLNIGLNLNSFTAYGGYGVDTIIHEEGHLLGLGHAGPYNGSVDPATQQLGPLDTRQWSIMSYINPWDSSARYYGSYAAQGTTWGTGADGYYREPTTWMPLDILAAQRLYGAPVNSPLSGGQIFGFHCNIAGPIEPFFDFTINSAPVVTLWDEGGGNTLDVSGFAAPAVIDLRPGGFSSVDGMTNDIAIAYLTAIDTAIGGPGSTTFVVNADSDSIVGGGGANTAVFAATGSYSDLVSGSGRVVTSGTGVADTLQGVGALAFTGGNDTIGSNVGGAYDLSGGPGADELFLNNVSAQVSLGSADTLVAAGGFTDVTAASGGPGDFVYGNSGGIVYHGGSSPDTIAGQALTVIGGSAVLRVYGAGNLWAQGGSAYGVYASFGASSETVQSGAGGGLLVGGAAGNNHFDVLGGSTDIFTDGQGDVATLANAALDIVIMAGGAETVDAAASSGRVVVYAGSGQDQITGGSGGTFVALGGGNSTIGLGSGINALLCVNGREGGTEVVTDWTPGRDYLFVLGYGAGGDQAAFASEVESGGNTLVTLADHTQIWFLNTNGVAASAFG